MDFNERIAKLNKMIAGARHIVFFTGAGISTGSGIPDFRSADGLYSAPGIGGRSPEYMLSNTCLYAHEEAFFQYLRDKMDFREAKPTIAHQKICKLQQARDVSVITQNIDGLHEETGMDKVYAVHGTMSRWYCQDCMHDIYVPEAVLDGNYDNLDAVPKCPLCGEGTIRPDIVLYGEGLAQPAWSNALMTSAQADLMIVVGSSLTVQPAASLPMYHSGPGLVIINRDPTPVDSYAALVFHEDIQDVFNLIEIPEGEV
jgi:NAD-dependent deacetylase